MTDGDIEFLGRKGPDGFRTMPKFLEDHANKLIHYVVNMKNLYEYEQLELVRVLEARYTQLGSHRFKYILEVMQAGKLKTIIAIVSQHPLMEEYVNVSVWRPHTKPPCKSSNQGGVDSTAS